jgi:hypothetical protein
VHIQRVHVIRDRRHIGQDPDSNIGTHGGRLSLRPLSFSDVAYWPFRTWSDVRLESVVRTKADSADYYRLMGSRPSTTLADLERDGIPKSVFL